MPATRVAILLWHPYCSLCALACASPLHLGRSTRLLHPQPLFPQEKRMDRASGSAETDPVHGLDTPDEQVHLTSATSVATQGVAAAGCSVAGAAPAAGVSAPAVPQRSGVDASMLDASGAIEEALNEDAHAAATAAIQSAAAASGSASSSSSPYEAVDSSEVAFSSGSQLDSSINRGLHSDMAFGAATARQPQGRRRWCPVVPGLPGPPGPPGPPRATPRYPVVPCGAL